MPPGADTQSATENEAEPPELLVVDEDYRVVTDPEEKETVLAAAEAAAAAAETKEDGEAKRSVAPILIPVVMALAGVTYFITKKFFMKKENSHEKV